MFFPLSGIRTSNLQCKGEQHAILPILIALLQRRKGCWQGRSNHIHEKVKTFDGSDTSENYPGNSVGC